MARVVIRIRITAVINPRNHSLHMRLDTFAGGAADTKGDYVVTVKAHVTQRIKIYP